MFMITEASTFPAGEWNPPTIKGLTDAVNDRGVRVHDGAAQEYNVSWQREVACSVLGIGCSQACKPASSSTL